MYVFIITTDPVEGNAPHRSLLTRGSSALLPVVLEEEEEEEREEEGGEGGEGEGGGESDELKNNCKLINIIYTCTYVCCNCIIIFNNFYFYFH